MTPGVPGLVLKEFLFFADLGIGAIGRLHNVSLQGHAPAMATTAVL